MPYVITTTATCDDCDGQGCKRPARAHMSHEVTDCPTCGTSGAVVVGGRAVATLDEARDEAWEIAYPHDQLFDSRWRDAAKAVSESGGTVGPLPDGTTITVKLATWAACMSVYEIQAGWPNDPERQRFALNRWNDAFNEANAHA